MERIDLTTAVREPIQGHTSKGDQPKWHRGSLWYKADHMGYEALAEVVISRLLEKTNVPEFVRYEPVWIRYEAGDAPGLTVIDCPPGSSCAVMESARGADYCVLVTEPTAFGLHDLRLVAELMRVLKKPCGVVVNKAGADYPELERWLEAEGLPVLARIPYSERLAELGARGALACREDEGARSLFSGLLTRIRGEAAE